jgi:hypothetical protein
MEETKKEGPRTCGILKSGQRERVNCLGRRVSARERRVSCLKGENPQEKEIIRKVARPKQWCVRLGLMAC